MNNSKQVFSPAGIIAKKRDSNQLTFEEIDWFITEFLKDNIADYQMSALLMAIFLQGFDKKETAHLTKVMLHSGTVLDFNDKTVIDKHSTGGIGDKTSFILAPIAAACGVKVPMIAGRGLGHSGGTVDKVEAIPGFKTSLSLEKFSYLVKELGLVLIGQTKDIAPADKRLYALRDVTSTVESIPLITASIMSKKLAEGASGIVMDIKVGNGAFMKTMAQARALAKSLRDTATLFDKSMLTMITDMSQPLGMAIGNSLEIIECVETLKGKGPKDLTELSLELAGSMVYLAGITKTKSAGIKKAKMVLKSGEALKRFEELIKNQGGDTRVINDYSILDIAPEIHEVKSLRKGFISSMDTKAFGLMLVELGGGRKKVDDKIDFGVGIICHKNLGDKVKVDDTLLTIYYRKNQKSLVQNFEEKFLESYLKLKNLKPKTLKPLIIEVKEN